MLHSKLMGIFVHDSSMFPQIWLVHFATTFGMRTEACTIPAVGLCGATVQCKRSSTGERQFRGVDEPKRPGAESTVKFARNNMVSFIVQRVLSGNHDCGPPLAICVSGAKWRMYAVKR